MADFMDNIGLTYYTNTAKLGSTASTERSLMCKSIASQDYDLNQTHIAWHISLDTLRSRPSAVSNIKLTIDGKVVYSDTSTQNVYSTTKIASGDVYIDHAYNGTKSIVIRLECNLEGSDVWGSSSITLPSIPRLSTVSINTVALGTNPTFTISKADVNYVTTSRMTTTLRYKVGTEEGTIVTKTSATTYDDWTLPIEWVLMFPDSQVGEGIIYCDAYSKNGVFTGTTSTTIRFTIPEKPSVNPTVVDTNSITLALTGDENKLVRFYSDALYKFNAAPGTGAALRKYRLETNGEIIEDTTSGTIYDVESGEFIFSVTDSRGFTVTETLNKTLVEYIKLTCNIWRISATADGTMVIGIGGDYFSGNFGAERNTLHISYRMKTGNGEFGEWQTIEYFADDNSYEVSVTLENMDYQTTYTFEAMVEDKLATVVSKQLPVRCLPVYDWGQNDFNVNVPFKMNQKTVLRHNHNANNVVLSASGGFIYFRPKGTDDNSIEVKISPQGNIELTGDILINGQSLKSLLGIT